MPSQSPAGLVRKTVNSTVKTKANAATPHAHDSQPRDAQAVAASLRGEHGDEERAGDEHRDERRLLGGEAEREQRADQRRLVAARAVEEAERDRQQRERDAGDVDVLAREAAVVEV